MLLILEYLVGSSLWCFERFWIVRLCDDWEDDWQDEGVSLCLFFMSLTTFSSLFSFFFSLRLLFLLGITKEVGGLHCIRSSICMHSCMEYSDFLSLPSISLDFYCLCFPIVYCCGLHRSESVAQSSVPWAMCSIFTPDSSTWISCSTFLQVSFTILLCESSSALTGKWVQSRNSEHARFGDYVQ